MSSLRDFVGRPKFWLAGVGVFVVAAVVLFWPTSDSAKNQSQEPFKRIAAAPPAALQGRKEIVEFFWYGCGHCYELEQHIDAWKKSLPADVTFRRVHVIWPGRQDVEAHARIFMAMERLGKFAELHRGVFDRVQQGRVELRKPEVLAQWVASKAVDPDAFMSAYGAVGDGASEIQRFAQETVQNDIHGVPAFVVNGQYLTSLSMVGGDPEKLLKQVNELLVR